MRGTQTDVSTNTFAMRGAKRASWRGPKRQYKRLVSYVTLIKHQIESRRVTLSAIFTISSRSSKHDILSAARRQVFDANEISVGRVHDSVISRDVYVESVIY